MNDTGIDLAPVPVCDLPATMDGEDGVLTADEAEAITSRIRRWANSFPVEDVVRAFRGRIWIALAYNSWAEWCECELGGLKLPVPQRREVVAELAGQGMSNRAIADTIGVDHKTVGSDLSASGENSPFDDTPRTTLGQDGRERSYPQPKPPAPEPEAEPEIFDAEIIEPPTRRKPLTDTARALGLDIDKLATRIERFAADDRLGRNKSEVALHLRHYLTQIIKVCQDLNHRFDN